MMLLQQYFVLAPPSMLSYGRYDPALVALSVLMAIFASWMGLQIAGQASANRAQRTVVLLTGSLALGSGVWAMHFIGMLAFDLCTRVDYDPALTILSLLPSIGASFVALSLIGRKRLGGWTLLSGGVLVGAGIGAMHYAGMAAMRMSLLLRYDPAMFALSIVVAVVLATLALWVRFGVRSVGARLTESHRLLISATVMGVAIAGMHYTGMAAARFVGQVAPGATGTTNGTFVALAIALITVALTIFVLAANGLLRYRQLFRELRHSEGWMRALLTTTVDGVITVDGDGVILEFNSAAERIFGWTRADILGRHIGLLVADHARSGQDGVLRLLGQRGCGLVGDDGEVTGLRKDGSEVPIRRALGHAHTDGEDRYVCFITDISERRAMEHALRDSEQQLRSLIGNIPGICYRSLVAGAQPMLFISDAVEAVTGYPAGDFIGAPARRSFGALLHPGDRARVSDAIAAALRERRPYLVEYRLLHADGSTRWLWENGTAVANDAGQLQWLDGVIVDISARREMEEALRLAVATAEQAAAARGSFVANMSHEIRTPMNAILGFTDVLLDGELAPAQRRHLDTVRSAGRSLLRLLNEILDTAKLEKGAVELELTDFDLLAVIDELSSTLGAQARAKGLHVDIDYHPALPTCLHGDELRIRQVLTNLLDNAIKFTAEGYVTLVAESLDEQLHVVVRDSGIGIAPDRLAAIFEPFTQADASMTRRYGGTGLGTTISKQLVELMGGRIWADSTPGAGAAFHVLLPLAPARFAPHQARARTARVLPPLRVLIADDVPQNLELLELLLQRRGHRTTCAADGAIALALANSEHFDLILMDLQMPTLDGLAATRQIRAAALQAGRARVPVVAMTASVLEQHRRAGAEAGMDGFATKPVDWFALSHEIARVLGLGEGLVQDLAPAPQRAVLNRHAGLRRWAGRSDAYLQELAHFARQYGALAEQLAGHAAAHQLQGAQMLAHKARGVAANLGLEQLAEALAELEHGCADAAVAPMAPALQQAVVAALAAALAAPAPAPARHRSPPAPPPAPPPPPAAAPAPTAPERAAFDQARALHAGEALRASLRRGALDDAALAELCATLGDHAGGDRLAPIHAALADFDFVLAQQRVEALLAILNADPVLE
ncbi:MAG: MHYT domain-containing protein [Pseudomonadota bacterium]|nr:MHYT domain-containing protein [Pseudomonadota bacterium]